MSVINAYRQGYSNSKSGLEKDNPYKRLNKMRDSYAWDRGFEDYKNGFVYQPPYSEDYFENGCIVSSHYMETKNKFYPWTKTEEGE